MSVHTLLFRATYDWDSVLDSSIAADRYQVGVIICNQIRAKNQENLRKSPDPLSREGLGPRLEASRL